MHNFKNGGREFRLKGNPVKVLVHDFKIPALGKVNPYGVYDISRNEGWVSVGTDHDTSAFAVDSIRQLEISVSHFPPGTSKWNKIEHKLFSFITQNGRGKPLISHEVIVSLIAATTTQKALHVECDMDKKVGSSLF